MNIQRMLAAACRRSRLRVQAADVDDLSSDVTLEILTGATPRAAVERVVMRYRRAMVRRPLALRIDIAGAMVPRDAVRWARQQRVRASKRRSNTAEVEIEG